MAEVKGNSMHPSLKHGWKIRIIPEDASDIQIGNVVVFGKDTLTCHRIIGKINFFGKHYFIQKGDNSYMGGIVKAEDLIGKVTEVFDEDDKRIDELEWRNKALPRGINVLYYLYLFMYFIKRCFWRNNINRLTHFVKRVYWKFI